MYICSTALQTGCLFPWKITGHRKSWIENSGVGSPDFQSKCVPVHLIEKTWIAKANSTLVESTTTEPDCKIFLKMLFKTLKGSTEIILKEYANKKKLKSTKWDIMVAANFLEFTFHCTFRCQRYFVLYQATNMCITSAGRLCMLPWRLTCFWSHPPVANRRTAVFGASARFYLSAPAVATTISLVKGRSKSFYRPRTTNQKIFKIEL